jgi:hypothetical protein
VAWCGLCRQQQGAKKKDGTMRRNFYILLFVVVVGPLRPVVWEMLRRLFGVSDSDENQEIR